MGKIKVDIFRLNGAYYSRFEILDIHNTEQIK